MAGWLSLTPTRHGACEMCQRRRGRNVGQLSSVCEEKIIDNKVKAGKYRRFKRDGEEMMQVISMGDHGGEGFRQVAAALRGRWKIPI